MQTGTIFPSSFIIHDISMRYEEQVNQQTLNTLKFIIQLNKKKYAYQVWYVLNIKQSSQTYIQQVNTRFNVYLKFIEIQNSYNTTKFTNLYRYYLNINISCSTNTKNQRSRDM